MSDGKQFLTLATAAAIWLTAPAAFATNGYFSHGYGTKSSSMGGAGVANPQDAMAAATNPAGMVFLGDRLDIGFGAFAPHRAYSISGNGFAAMNNGQASDIDFFVVPHVGFNYMLGANSSFGVSVYGNGGMNSEYAKPVFGAFGGTAPAGIDMIQMFVALTFSQKLTAHSAVGVSVIPVLQTLKAYGIQPFQAISQDPAHVSNNGIDTATGWGYKLGGQTYVGGGVTLGASYQPRINMREWEKYAGLLAGGGDFDVPSTYTVGASWRVLPGWDLMLDFMRINYTDVGSVSNPSYVPPPFGPPGRPQLGAADGPGFGWSDIDVYKLGTQYAAGNWIWRAGWNHGDNPIGHDQVELMFNILAPGVVRDHLTLGVTRLIGTTSEISFMYMHGFRNKVSGSIPATAANFGGGDISIEMYQNAVDLSVAVKF